MHGGVLVEFLTNWKLMLPVTFLEGVFAKQADDGGQKPNANTDLPQLRSDTTVDVNLIRHVSIMTCKEA